MAVEHDIVKKSGAWFTYEGEQLGQGRENVRKLLKDNPELTEELQYKVLVKLGVIEPEEEETAEEAGAAPEVDPLDEIAEESNKYAERVPRNLHQGTRHTPHKCCKDIMVFSRN